MIRFLDLNAQYLSIKGDIDAAIADVIARSAFIRGPHVTEFEQAFAAWIGAEHCVGVGNGTDALEIAIEALDLPRGSEIIVPGNSFIASSEAVSRSGHVVVFADADARNYTLNPSSVRAKITPRTKALMPVHLYGHPCDMHALMAIAREYGLRVIEDCAQAHGAQFNGQKVGTFGDLATWSFYPGKNLGAFGDAGALTIGNAELAQRVRMIANHGRVGKYDHDFEGRNSRLDGLQAAILSAKLTHLDGWTNTRIALADAYLSALADVGDITLPVRQNWARQVYHLFVIRTKRRSELADHLKARGIETGVHYPTALPKLKAYQNHPQHQEALEVCAFDSQLLSLPIGEHMSLTDVDLVSSAIRDFFAA